MTPPKLDAYRSALTKMKMVEKKRQFYNIHKKNEQLHQKYLESRDAKFNGAKNGYPKKPKP